MKYFVLITAVLFLTGMAVWLMLFRSYMALLADIRHGTYKTPLIKQIVLKYSNCKKLDISINNVNVFVEKIVDNYKIGRLRFDELIRVGKGLEYFIIMIGILSAFILRNSFDAANICVAVAALSAMALHLMDKVTNPAELSRMIIVETVDYLENTGEHRYTVREQYEQKLTKEAASEFEKLNKSYDKIEASSIHEFNHKGPKDSKVISDIINEFLT